VSALKKEACLAHASQSPEKFYLCREVTLFRGIESGHKEAEGFIDMCKRSSCAALRNREPQDSRVFFVQSAYYHQVFQPCCHFFLGQIH